MNNFAAQLRELIDDTALGVSNEFLEKLYAYIISLEKQVNEIYSSRE